MRRLIREVQPKWVVGENVLGLVNWSGGLVFEEVQADLESEGYEVQPYVLPAASVNAPHKRDRVWFVAFRTTPHPGELRLELGPTPRTLGKGQEKICREGNKPSLQPTANGKVEPVANANILRNTSFGEGKEIEGVGCGNNGEQKTGGEQTERADGLFGLQPNAADTDKRAGETLGQGKLLEEQKGKGEARGFANGCPRDSWLQFPTQPPLRWRNDGVSPELVGITVSKHRNESIKAYGNAIVPQVVYQIFKAINEYQTKTT